MTRIGSTVIALLLVFGAVPVPGEAADPRVRTPHMQVAEVSITITPNAVPGGVAATGTVRMTGIAPAGAVIALSATPAIRGLGVPASLNLASGGTFTIATPAVAADTVVTVSATYRGVTARATLTIQPVKVRGVSCSPADVYGGLPVSCQVTLTGPAPAGAVATLIELVKEGEKEDIATVPPTVALASTSPGKPPLVPPYSYGIFPLTTRPVARAISVRVGAQYNGSWGETVVWLRPAVLSSVTCASSSVTGGNPLACRATLTGPAPAGGVAVALASHRPSILSVPSSVQIPQTSGDFTASTVAVNADTPVIITGSYGQTKTTTVQVAAAPPPTLPDLGFHGGSFTFYDAQTGNGILGPQAGRAFRMCINVVNWGQAQAGSSTLFVELYGSGLGKIREWTPNVPALAPGAGANPCFDVQALDAGRTYDFSASADAGRAVDESNENNNRAHYARGL